MRPLNLRDLLRCPSRDNFAAFVSRLWSQIDDPVGTFNHFEIVLDHDDRMPGVDQPLEQLQQHRDIIEMQAGSRFVEDEEISKRFFCRGSRAGCTVFACRRHACHHRFVSEVTNEF